MKIRTLEELTDVLDQDLAWRKKELTTLKLLLSSKRDTEHRDTFIRSATTVLYAHWEGFIKSAATAYVNYVSLKRLPYRDLAPNFVALTMKAKLNQALQSNKPTVYSEVARFFLQEMGSPSAIPWDSSIHTMSNLNSSVLREITCVIGLDFSPYETKEKLIDEKLLRTRNEIAHGRGLFIGVDEYFALHQQVMDLLDLFRNQVENAAATKAYAAVAS